MGLSKLCMSFRWQTYIKCRKNTCSFHFVSFQFHFSYKRTFNRVFFGLVDADYTFRQVDVGCNRRIRDGGVFGNTSIFKALKENSLNILAARSLQTLPFVVKTDNVFPLKNYLIKRYLYRHLTIEQQNFNHKLSRARRVVENDFGIRASRLPFT